MNRQTNRETGFEAEIVSVPNVCWGQSHHPQDQVKEWSLIWSSLHLLPLTGLSGMTALKNNKWVCPNVQFDHTSLITSYISFCFMINWLSANLPCSTNQSSHTLSFISASDKRTCASPTDETHPSKRERRPLNVFQNAEIL